MWVFDLELNFVISNVYIPIKRIKYELIIKLIA
jgi:hypothetical protein